VRVCIERWRATKAFADELSSLPEIAWRCRTDSARSASRRRCVYICAQVPREQIIKRPGGGCKQTPQCPDNERGLPKQNIATAVVFTHARARARSFSRLFGDGSPRQPPANLQTTTPVQSLHITHK